MVQLVEGPVKRLATGLGFTEGPVWLSDQGALLFTDIPANVILRWQDGSLSTWIDNSHFAIGLCRGPGGRILACEHSTRILAAIEVNEDGSAGRRHVLAEGYQGCVLNSTNDVITTSDGNVLFTDPPFGVRALDGGLHGYQQASELAACHVFRTTGDPKAPVSLTSEVYRPNGLCLSPDEKTLYVSDSSETHHKVVAFEVGQDWTLSRMRDFAVMPVGVPDGMRVDAKGNLWVAGGDGVYVYNPGGENIGHVPVPEMVTNIEFGSADHRSLFITATSSLYLVRTRIPGGRASEL